MTTELERENVCGCVCVCVSGSVGRSRRECTKSAKIGARVHNDGQSCGWWLDSRNFSSPFLPSPVARGSGEGEGRVPVAVHGPEVGPVVEELDDDVLMEYDKHTNDQLV